MSRTEASPPPSYYASLSHGTPITHAAYSPPAPRSYSRASGQAGLGQYSQERSPLLSSPSPTPGRTCNSNLNIQVRCSHHKEKSGHGRLYFWIVFVFIVTVLAFSWIYFTDCLRNAVEREHLFQRWIDERTKLAHERREWHLEGERRRREIEEWERIKRNGYWDEPRPGRCVAYDVRLYEAKLHNAPDGFGGIQACRESPIDIHGVTYATPHLCTDHNDIIGQWQVSEAICRPFWSNFEEGECVSSGSGLRRGEARLDDTRPGDDWEQLCATSEANIHGQSMVPKTCRLRSVHRRWSMFGTWEFEDPSC